MRQKFLYHERRLKAQAPEFVRRIYRMVRSFYPQPVSAPLPDRLVEDCRFCASRIRQLDYLPKKGKVCEVGTYKGDFAREIVKLCEPSELHLIDIDYTYFDDEGLTAGNIMRHQGISVELLNKFPDEFFDWVYIDANHSYEAVLADARASRSKIKPGGYIVFNDFAHIDPYLGRYGVHRAATDFALASEWPLKLFSYHGAALYDVAFQKPDNCQGSRK